MEQAHALSVVIPVLDEVQVLPGLLKQLNEQQHIQLDLIVADGGSSDGSRAAARQLGARVVQSAAGRGRQMNAGARAARHSLLLFIHADSSLDDPQLLYKALKAWTAAQAECALPVAGHFPLRFCREQGDSRLAYRYLEAKSASNRPQTINGDQGLLISGEFFDSLGGFDESMTFMEDQAIAARIFAAGRWLLLPGELGTSARRFEVEGFARRYLLMGLIMAFYRAGRREFFERARNVYRHQGKTGQLRMAPFFLALWQVLLRDLRPQQSLALLYHFGRYGLHNLWQVFSFLDVAMGTGSRPLTRLHDRLLPPSLKRPWLAALLTLPAAAVLSVLYLLILTPLFCILDATGRARAAGRSA